MPDPAKTVEIFGRKLENPAGPAAGPHTQLAQNLVAAYYAGARFFELKTVQKMDGPELSACIPKPCIVAEDEAYNCEWSTELYVPPGDGRVYKRLDDPACDRKGIWTWKSGWIPV